MIIEIITTPNEFLKETGFGPHQACLGIMQSLVRRKHSVVVTSCENEDDLNEVVKRNPNIVMLAVKYITETSGRKIWLSEYFEERDIFYTGSCRATLSYDSNKVSAKMRITSKGMATAEYFVAVPNEFKTSKDLPLPFPLFLKPSDAANGNGVDSESFVTNFSEYHKKLTQLYGEFGEPVLVEEYLDGIEFTVSLIESGGNLSSFVIEVIPPEDHGIRVLGVKTKTENTEVLRIIDNQAVYMEVKKFAEHAFRALGARDFGRIDIKMDRTGKCYFLEANLVPGLKKGSSYFPRACELDGHMNYDSVISELIRGVSDRKIERLQVTKVPQVNGGHHASMQ